MPKRRAPSRRRVIASTFAWALALLLLTNVGWSCWFAWRMNGIEDIKNGMFTHRAYTLYADDSERFVSKRSSTTFDVILVHNEYRAASTRHRDMTSDPTTWPQIEDAFDPWELQAIQSVWGEKPERWNLGVIGTVGWPLRFLWCAVDDVQFNRGIVCATTGIDTGLRRSPHSFPRALPFRPVWSGQLGCGMFFFGVVSIVKFGFRSSRRRRGHCHECNYDLRGNTNGVCPECGAAIPRHRSGKVVV